MMETITSILEALTSIIWLGVIAAIACLFLPPRYDPFIRLREWLNDDKGSADD